MTTDPHARLAEFLSVGDSRQNLPGVKIRDAATMLVIDRTGATPKVLLGRRHHGHKFMPGKYVFPGGRVELVDRRMRAATPLDPRVEARLMKETRYPGPEKARGYPLAAIREVFEETGLVLGTKSDAPAHPPNAEWVKFAATGVAPDLAVVHFIARAITPPGRPRRFDTRFFAVDADAVAARIEGVAADRGKHETRHAGHHHGGTGRAEDQDRQRLYPRPAGAVLSHAARQAPAGVFGVAVIAANKREADRRARCPISCRRSSALSPESCSSAA
jgi:8-oxo-dGTP pyrophosphatase MutT (NUDIX family)